MKRTNMKRRGALALLPILLWAVLTSGCDPELGFGGDEYPADATTILEVRVVPNPVVAGDTAVFTAVIADSLEDGFIYTWNTPGIGFEITETNRFEWIAPADTGTYTHFLSVDREGDFREAQESFKVVVIPGD